MDKPVSMPPVAVFAYRRPESLRATLASLSACEGASEVDLTVFVDAPGNIRESGLVEETGRVACAAGGFRKVEVRCAENHLGLGKSVMEGVSSILERQASVIVLEDDLTVQPGFLRFVWDGLERYAADQRVFSVCGYTSCVHIPENYPADAYFCPRSSSWGWATWKDRWESVDWNPAPSDWARYRRTFADWGGSDCPDLLRGWMEGRNESWAIRFCFSEFLQGKVSLFPVKSLVDPSAGFDGSGTNCPRYSRFRFDLDARPGPFRYPGTVEVVPSIRKSALHYHSLPLRAWSRLRNLFA